MTTKTPKQNETNKKIINKKATKKVIKKAIKKPKENIEGEIWVQGPNIFKGYHGKEKETKEVLIDNWYRTGDIGKFDKGGNLTICGRAKHMIIVAGENVYPAEIEDVVNHIKYQESFKIHNDIVLEEPHTTISKSRGFEFEENDVLVFVFSKS